MLDEMDAEVAARGDLTKYYSELCTIESHVERENEKLILPIILIWYVRQYGPLYKLYECSTWLSPY